MIERIDPLIHRFIEPLKRFARGPYALISLIGIVLALGGLALHERDARLRRSFELEQLKSETAARVKELEERAAAALDAANQRNAQVIRELEASRRKLAQQGDKLRERLAALERDERVRVERVATLPSHELAERVAARLDADAVVEEGLHGPPAGGAQGPSPTRTPEPPPQSSLALDPGALRKVETAFVELDACREQAAVKDEQVANCGRQLASSAAIADRLNDSLRQLNEAVRLKDEILARREAEHRAELKAARGSRWARFKRALEYVAVGAALGAVAAR
jgi:hypothetical protein